MAKRATAPTGVVGSCYLVHFESPFGHARHYLGWAHAGRLEARLAHHERGTGANLLRHVREAGIGWELARVWEGVDRNFERSQKRNGHAAKCPVCRAQKRAATETAA